MDNDNHQSTSTSRFWVVDLMAIEILSILCFPLLLQPLVALSFPNQKWNTGVDELYPDGALVDPQFIGSTWSTSLVISLVIQYASVVCVLFIDPSNDGVVISYFELVSALEGNCITSPDVKYHKQTFQTQKLLDDWYLAYVLSTTHTPFYPKTFPSVRVKQKAVFQSTPTPIDLLVSLRSGTSLASLPRASKWLSNRQSAAQTSNPGSFPPLSWYCRPFVPFLVSAKPLPLTSPSLTDFVARPAFLLKNKCPKEIPYPKVGLLIIIVPADVPANTTQSLLYFARTLQNNGLHSPLSSNHVLACRAWSPPLKKMISASCIMFKLCAPSAVDRSVDFLQLSMWEDICLEVNPFCLNMVQYDGFPAVSLLKASLPSFSLGAAEVTTATLGQTVLVQSSEQRPGQRGFPVTLPIAVQIQPVSAKAPPIRKSLVEHIKLTSPIRQRILM